MKVQLLKGMVELHHRFCHSR